MEYQFNDSGVKGILILENFASNLEKVLPKTQIETIIVTSIGEMHSWLKGALINFAVRNIKKWSQNFKSPTLLILCML